MNIRGKYLIAAPTHSVWRLLMDFAVLERITPGISQLLPIADDKYKAISNIKIGPVRGYFEGDLKIMDKEENSTATLVMDQKSKIGNVTATITMHLNPMEDSTEIDYKGEAKLSGKLAMMGQRIIGGVISSLAKQFFAALDKEIKNVNNNPNSYAN
jgi:carbon monoxide dehydrogenase subunit G